MTYPQWRTNTRVFHAMIQLAEGATVTATAHRCGQATTSAFIDTFTRTMGKTPGSYRAASDRTAPEQTAELGREITAGAASASASPSAPASGRQNGADS